MWCTSLERRERGKQSVTTLLVVVVSDLLLVAVLDGLIVGMDLLIKRDAGDASATTAAGKKKSGGGTKGYEKRVFLVTDAGMPMTNKDDLELLKLHFNRINATLNIMYVARREEGRGKRARERESERVRERGSEGEKREREER